MLIALDIGNTNITLGYFEGKKLGKRHRYPTSGSLEELSRDLAKLRKVDGLIVSSVVPKVLTALERKLSRLLNVKPLVLGRDLDYGIPNLYKYPSQVGSDRLVNAVAAKKLYGSPLIVVDFGTAITFDLISKRGEYVGGIIVPGIELSLKALSRAAALLPEVELKKPRALLGKETKESMISGAIYGFSALCDGIVARLKKEYGYKPCVVATGGLSKRIAAYCSAIDEVNPWLTLEGLRLIYENKEKLWKKGCG